MTKTIDQRIAVTREKISQYEKQIKQLVQKQREAERKARTHRLIERGALLESLLDGADALTNEDIKAVLTAALNSEAAFETLVFIRKRQGAVAVAEPEPVRKTGNASDKASIRETRPARTPESIRGSRA